MNEKTICKKYGCDFEEQYMLHDAIVQICVKCGRRIVFQVSSFNGKHDERSYAKENKRALLQPWQTKAYVETRLDQQWVQKMVEHGFIKDSERVYKSGMKDHRSKLVANTSREKK